jgi:2-keto-4-pentenoate hydratase/2-oxohepta-3-ene-1,7-dioic acid hydratase in catechol pathway/L-rhamnose mutarotase|tara:strand:+ start:2656 stop:3918 length:1263 start_codon:yes stop_codon:yes gene_type:complete
LVVAAAAAPSPDARAEAMRRYMFTVEVKPECLASYKSHHDNIWPEVAAGLRRAGIAQLTTWQLGNSTRLFMYIETAGDIDLGAAVGPGSTYREHAKCIEWENLMDSFFVGGDWTQMSEIHSDDIEWNAALSLPPPSAMATPTRVIRFIGADGEVHLGEEPSAAGAQSALLSGSILDGTQKRTGKYATVVTLLAPLIPTNIFCIGLNYMRHYEESAKKRGIALPAKPVIFMKPSSALNHPGGDIYIPDLPRGDELDYEIELAVVIGKAARNVSAADALDYVAGYTVSNDVSSRHWQKQSGAGQWIKGKSFDTFCPLGPVFVSSAAIADPQNLSCKTRVNGETRQDSNTSDMIFTVARIVEWLSTDMTLLPGTVILTGTPEGVGAGKTPPVWLVEGDVVECEIESIGILRNCVTRAPTLSAL